MGQRCAAPNVLVPAVASRGGDSTCALDRGCSAQSKSQPANTGSDRARDSMSCDRRGNRRRSTAAHVQERPCQPQGRMRCWTLAMVASSELLLRMVVVACLSDYCDRFHRPKPLWMARASRASLHVLGAGTRIWHPAARRPHAVFSRRSISRLLKANARFFPVAIEIMHCSTGHPPMGRPRTSVLKQPPGRSRETKWIM